MNPAADSVSCSVCGRSAETDEQDALTWLREVDASGRASWVCPGCTREHLRAVEAKLDREWW